MSPRGIIATLLAAALMAVSFTVFLGDQLGHDRWRTFNLSSRMTMIGSVLAWWPLSRCYQRLAPFRSLAAFLATGFAFGWLIQVVLVAAATGDVGFGPLRAALTAGTIGMIAAAGAWIYLRRP